MSIHGVVNALFAGWHLNPSPVAGEHVLVFGPTALLANPVRPGAEKEARFKLVKPIRLHTLGNAASLMQSAITSREVVNSTFRQIATRAY